MPVSLLKLPTLHHQFHTKSKKKLSKQRPTMAEVATSQSHDYGLRCVTSPVGPMLEVIFVHGLGGHRTKTWQNSQQDFWPSWFNELTPTTRVWTYGYNAGLWKDPSQDALDLHCTELLECCVVKSEIGSSDVPVVFICHSLGGILVKAVSHTRAPRSSTC